MGRNKVFTFINVSGLAIGMAACMLILLFVQDELSYDSYHDNSDRIYRVTREWKNADGETSLHLGHVAPPFGPLISNDFEGIVEHTVRFLNDDPLMTYTEGDKKIEEERFFFVEANVFDVFSYEMLDGDPETALKEPNSLVLTASTAQKYFGDENPMGKTLNYDNVMDMKVTGIVADVPHNSHFQFDILCSFQTVENFFGRERLMQNYGSNNYSTFLLLKEGYDPKDLEAKFPDFLDKHMGQTNGIDASQRNRLHLWALTDIHLHSNLDSEIEANSDIVYVYIFSIIAALILLIACFNFINLSTAQSSKRAKEVGLRKVIGAHRMTLVRQFLTESLVLSLLALGVALVLVHTVLPAFNNFLQRDLAMNYANNGFTLMLLVGITLISGLVAGSYPAFYLSAFQPSTILRGDTVSGKRSPLRSMLVVMQFAISIALIIGVGIVQDQLEFVRTKPLGFDKEDLVVLPINSEIYNKYESLKTQWLSQPGISDVTISSRVPSGRLLDSQNCKAEIDGEMENINLRIADIHVGHDYFNTYNMEFVAGRNFDRRLASDSTEAFILNESSVEAIGWASAEDAIDKKFNYGMRQGRIVGIVKDFHFENLRQEIAPMAFFITSGRANVVSMRVHGTARAETLQYLEDQWAFLRPGFPFTPYMVEDRFNEQYSEDERLGKVIAGFSLLAVIIAALGLFGLASYTAEQRTREIGIRKVLGASVSQILILLTKRFTLLVIIGFILAAALSTYFMDWWLESFAYATQLNMSSFLFAGLAAIFIAWFTVAYHSLKAATGNPVEAIRQE